MIIRPDKTFETHSMYPDSDWYNEGNVVIADGSELALKVLAHSPYMELVYEDGVLVDVRSLPKPEPRPQPSPSPTTEELLQIILAQAEAIAALSERLGG